MVASARVVDMFWRCSSWIGCRVKGNSKVGGRGRVVCVCVHTQYALLQGQDLASILYLKTFGGSRGPRDSPDALLTPSSPLWSDPC